MSEKKTYYKIGEITNLEKKIAITGDLGQGYGYKDEKAFADKKGICYIPEHAFSDIDFQQIKCDECEGDEEKFDDSFTYQDFYDLAKKFKEDNEISDEHSIGTIAQNLFEMVDWQYPSTLVSDWENSGAYED